jgi:prolyl oligopeptidase
MSFLSSHPELVWPLSNDGDPFITLESLDSTKVDAWVGAQNDRTENEFGKTPAADALTARLAKAYTSQDRIVTCSRYGDWGYNTWQDDEHPLGIVRRTPWSAWLAGKPDWQTVLDVDALDLNNFADNDTRWALHDFDMVYPTWDRALVSLSPGGSDACIVREFDVESRAFVEGGFELPDVGKHGISWIDRDSVYVGWDNSAHSKKPALTTSGFPREARRWSRGTPLAEAPVVFEGKRRDVSAGADYDPLEKLHLASRCGSRPRITPRPGRSAISRCRTRASRMSIRSIPNATTPCSSTSSTFSRRRRCSTPISQSTNRGRCSHGFPLNSTRPGSPPCAVTPSRPTASRFRTG